MTDRQVTRFLAEMRVTANTTFACGAAAVTYRQAIRRRNTDPEFEREWRDAVEMARSAARMRALDYPATHA